MFPFLPKSIFCPLSDIVIKMTKIWKITKKNQGGEYNTPYSPPPFKAPFFSDVSIESALERIAISPKLINAPINILDISGQ